MRVMPHWRASRNSRQLFEQRLQRLQDLCMILALPHKLAFRPEPLRDPERRTQIRTARHELVQHLQRFTAEASRKTGPRQPQGLTHAVYAQFREPLQHLRRPAQCDQRQRTHRAHQVLLIQHFE